MEEGSGYDESDGAIASYDQLKAHAIDQLRKCDSFIAVVGNIDNSTRSGMALLVVSATKTPFAPYFLAEAVNATASVALQSMEALVDESEES